MLTDKQTRFIREYLRAPEDPTGAALRAGYSPGRARRQAREMLERPEVRERLRNARTDAAAEAVSPARVIRELARIAFADPAEMLGMAARATSVGRGLAPAGTEANSSPAGVGVPHVPSVGRDAHIAPHPPDDHTDTLAGAGVPDDPEPNGVPGGVRATAQGSPCETPAAGAEPFLPLAPTPASPPFVLPGSGTGLKLKYTPKRAPDGSTVFELSMEREVRVGDKLRALEMLSKFLGVAVPPSAGDDDGGDGGGLIVLPEVEE